MTAPLFWGLLLGLPGILAYKAVNTADSMIGHRTERHEAFGWATARLDDLVNLPPARLSALLLIAAAALSERVHAAAASRATWRDAHRHRSPNAGYPESAMAGALGLALAGPRHYADEIVEDPWIGGGTARATTADMARALRLYYAACLLLSGGLILSWAALHVRLPA